MTFNLAVLNSHNVFTVTRFVISNTRIFSQFSYNPVPNCKWQASVFTICLPSSGILCYCIYVCLYMYRNIFSVHCTVLYKNRKYYHKISVSCILINVNWPLHLGCSHKCHIGFLCGLKIDEKYRLFGTLLETHTHITSFSSHTK